MNPGNTGRPRDALCDEFLASHCEYTDGLLSPLALARLRAHVADCDSCARYDRIVLKGLDLVRDLPAVEPSDDFELRLQHRIFHVRDADALRPRTAGAAATLAVAAVIALLAWSPLLLAPGQQPYTAQSVPEAADPVFAGFGAIPLISEPAWLPPATLSHHAPATVLAAFPGPYSPLVVTPPAHRSVRTVSAGYTLFD